MTTDQPTLRYGLLLEHRSLARWQVAVLDHLDSVAGVELCVVGVDTAPRRRPTVRGLWDRQGLAWTVYNRAVSRRSRAVERVDLGARFDDAPVIDAPTTGAGPWYELHPEAISALEHHRPDFILRFGSRLIRGPVLTAAPLGVWSFHHGDEQVHRGGPPCFWELVDRDPVTGVLLQRLTDRIDAGVPLSRAHFSTVGHSYLRNRDQAYLGAAPLPAQVCRRILAGGTEAIDLPVSSTDAPVRRAPSGRALARFLPQLLVRWCAQQVTGLTTSDRWHVGIVDRPIASFLEVPGIDDVRWLPRPRGSSRYVADPFGCTSARGTTVLVEDYDHRERHGVVSAYRLPADGSPEGPFRVKAFAEHASYPSLTPVDGEWWCIPEQAKAGSVHAYRFDPDELLLDDLGALLPGVALSDPTMFEWQGRWWLLGTDHGLGSNSHLRAWFAPHPRGPWEPHPVHPLKIDVRSARPAGTPFVVDGTLYRPAQDCSSSYGGAVVLNRVDRLDPEGFSEVPAARVEPPRGGSYPNGVHTLSGIGDRTLVDGTRHRFSFPAFRHELRARARLITGR